MERVDVLVIGGGPAGITAAISAKRNYPERKVLLLRKEERVVIPCAIPYLPKTIGSVEKNLIPDAILEKNGVEYRVRKVEEIDLENKVVVTNEKERIAFEKLILATGSQPFVPPIDGINLENVFFIKKDAGYLSKVCKTLNSSERILIVGGGFIGVELADELSRAGKKVTIVERSNRCLSVAFDEEFCEKVEEILKSSGVTILTSKSVERFEGDGKVERVILDDGEKLEVDCAVVCVGVRPEVELAKERELKVDEKLGIWVDEYQRTSHPDVFAAGDCCQKFSFFTKAPVNVRLASVATREARIASANLFEEKVKNEGVVSTFSTCVGGRTFAVSGLTKTLAEREGIEVVESDFKTVDRHPGSLSGASEVYLKLFFEKESKRLVGGEIVGGVSAGEMINLVSLMIEKKLTAKEIVRLQFATHPLLTPSPIAYPLVNAAEKLVR